MRHVLILEQYQPTRQALELTLHRAGWKVTLTTTDRETLEVLERKPYDVVLIDLDMPTGDGWRVLETLSTTHNPTPVIALLGQESHRRPDALNLGVKVILSKPLGRRTLLAGLRTVRGSSSERREYS